MLILCNDARSTVVPSNSTGSNTATGFINPDREVFHSIFNSVVAATSSAHLKANAFLSWLTGSVRLSSS